MAGLFAGGLLGKKLFGGDKSKTVVNETSDEDKDRIQRMKEIDSRDRMRGANIRQRRTAIDTNQDSVG